MACECECMTGKLNGILSHKRDVYEVKKRRVYGQKRDVYVVKKTDWHVWPAGIQHMGWETRGIYYIYITPTIVTRHLKKASTIILYDWVWIQPQRKQYNVELNSIISFNIFPLRVKACWKINASKCFKASAHRWALVSVDVCVTLSACVDVCVTLSACVDVCVALSACVDMRQGLNKMKTMTAHDWFQMDMTDLKKKNHAQPLFGVDSKWTTAAHDFLPSLSLTLSLSLYVRVMSHMDESWLRMIYSKWTWLVKMRAITHSNVRHGSSICDMTRL